MNLNVVTCRCSRRCSSWLRRRAPVITQQVDEEKIRGGGGGGHNDCEASLGFCETAVTIVGATGENLAARHQRVVHKVRLG